MTETIDKLYLELSQFTRAENAREAELLNCIRRIGRVVGCGHTEDADGRARLVRCVEEQLFSAWVGKQCNGCGKPLWRDNLTLADCCPCNSGRGINHGLIPKDACTCDVCDPARTGSSRWGKPG